MIIDFSNGNVMKVICFIVSVLLCAIVGICTNNFRNPKWALAIPTLICLILMIPSFCIIVTSNGIGKYTGNDILGLFMYVFWVFIFSGTIEIIILITKLINKR